MFGKQELERLRQRKQVLILESDRNRVRLRAECQALSQAVTPLTSISRFLPKPSALMLILAPIAGLLLARGRGSSHSWLSRLASGTKWLVPLYQVWRGLRS